MKTKIFYFQGYEDDLFACTISMYTSVFPAFPASAGNTSIMHIVQLPTAAVLQYVLLLPHPQIFCFSYFMFREQSKVGTSHIWNIMFS
jgi:hypothetical protein